MIASSATLDRPVRLWARTWQGFLGAVGVAAAFATFVDLTLAYGFDAMDWAPALWPLCFASSLFLLLAITAEWTVEGEELRRRSWLSRPGRQPSAVMELGPGLEIVHESRSTWRFRPNGYAIGAAPWQTTSLTGVMKDAGVRIDDWRGEWAKRHRRLDMLGKLATAGGIVGMIFAIAQGPWWSHSVGSAVATEVLSTYVLLLGLSIDVLPWRMRKRTSR